MITYLRSLFSLPSKGPQCEERTHYSAFNWLRLLLAASVVYLHAHNHTGPDRWVFLWPAVPSFLAISGFLILSSREHSRSWGHWAWKRFVRIAPAFVASFVLLAVVAGPHTLWPTLQQYLTLGMGGPKMQGYNGVLWSLGWEELFYGMMCIAFALGAYRSSAFAWTGLAITLCLGTVLQPYLPSNLSGALPLGPAFFLGNLAYLYRGCLSLKLAALPAVALVFTAGRPGYEVQFLAVTAFAALTIILGSQLRVPELKFDASYGCYIYGAIGMRLVMYYTHDRLEVIVASLVLALALGIVSWFTIEKPALAFKNLRACKDVPSGRTVALQCP